MTVYADGVGYANEKGIGATATGCALSTALAERIVSVADLEALTANATCIPTLTYLFAPEDNTILLIFTEPVVPLAATAATATLPATSAIGLQQLQLSMDGIAGPTSAVLSPVLPLPPSATTVIDTAAAASAVAYRLDLNLDPPAAGGEQLTLALPAQTMIGI